MTLNSLKIAWSAFFDGIGTYDRRLREAANERIWLMPLYHRILRDGEDDPFGFGLGVSEKYFNDHLIFYRENFHVCTVHEGLRISESGDWPDRPMLSITFDDGYLDNADLALPLLSSHDCRATFFICTGPISEGWPFWWDVVIASAAHPSADHWQSLLKALGVQPGNKPEDDLRRVLGQLWTLRYDEIQSFVDFDQAAEEGLDHQCPARMERDHVINLAKSGMEIAAHTHHHPNLTRESDAMIEDEIVRSRAILEDWIGNPVLGFATPHGFVDERVKAICAQQGFAYIASTDRGCNNEVEPFHLARFGAADAGLSTLKRSLTNSLNA